MIAALALLTALGTTPAQDGDWVRYVRSSEDGRYILISPGTPQAAMLEVLPRNSDAPFRLLWSKAVVEPQVQTGLGGAAFSWNGKMVAVSDQGDHSGVAVTLYDTVTGKRLHKFDATVFNNANIRFSPDDRYIYAWGRCDYFKADVATGRVIYRGDFMPLRDGEEPGGYPMSASTWPDPVRAEVWHFEGSDGTKLSYDKLQNKPVVFTESVRSARWYGRWIINAATGLVDAGGGPGPMLATMKETLAEGLFVRTKGSLLAFRPAHKQWIYLDVPGGMRAAMAIEGTVWSQFYELLTEMVAINPVKTPESGVVRFDFIGTIEGEHFLTLIARFPESGEPLIIAYTPDKFYAPITGGARALSLLPEGTTWVKDAQGVRSVLFPLLSQSPSS